MKRILAVILALIVVLSTLTMFALAEEAQVSAEAIESITANTYVNNAGQVVKAFDITFTEQIDATALDISNFALENAYISTTADQKSYGVYKVITDDATNSLTIEVEPFLYYQKEPAWMVSVVIDEAPVAAFTKDDVTVEKVDVADKFEKYVSDEGMAYSLFVPELAEGEKAPLIVVTHGGGETGTDNHLPLVANRMNLKWAEPETQARHKAFVLAGQSPADWDADSYANLRLIIDRLLSENPQIDADRIYVSEFYPRNEISFTLRNADIVAAVIAMGGFEEADADLTPVKDIAFCLLDDEGGNYTLYDIAEKLEALGDTKVMTKLYSAELCAEYGMFGFQASHFVWVPMLNDFEVEEWLFAQSK